MHVNEGFSSGWILACLSRPPSEGRCCRSRVMAKLSLILLLGGLGCLMRNPGGSSAMSKTYYRTTVSSENITSSSISEVISVDNLIKCAQQANKRFWCHLICYDNPQCSLYNMRIPKIHNITTATIHNCWTDAEVFTCPSDFVSVPGAGCLYVNADKGTMATADTFCTSINSRLVIPDDVAALTAFAKGLEPLEKFYWVGIKDGKWMDGTPVLESQWGRADHGSAACAYLHEAVEYGIIGYGCDFDMPSICQYVE